jgi:predicted nuclease with TOPRIM domain
MDIADLKKILETEEGKTLLEEFVPELRAKKNELLAEKKNIAAENKKLKEQLEQIEAERLEEQEKLASKSGDVEKVKAQLKERYDRELNQYKEKYSKVESQLHKHVIEEGLVKELVGAGVKKEFLPAATALIKTAYQAEIAENDGKPFAKFDGKAVNEFVAEWSKSDTGKHFVSADKNSGGGAQGANGVSRASGAKSMTRTDWNALPQLEKSRVLREGTVLTD